MLERIIEIKPLENYGLHIEFEDGLSGEINIGGILNGPVFGPLRDPGLFNKVIVDAFGAPYWPNGADLAPDALYQNIKNGKLQLNPQ